MKLLRGKTVEVIQGAKSMTLDELYGMAQQEGRPEIGSIFGPHACSIKVSGIGDHYVSVVCRRYPTAVQNLAECISAARRVREVLSE